MKKLNELKKNVDKNDVISFSIFDTLLLRNTTYKTDIFKIMEIEFKNKYGNTIGVDFSALRIEAEKNIINSNEKYSITLDMIYDVLGKEIKDSNLLNSIKEIEIEIIKKFTTPNLYIKDIFEYAKTKNKEIVIITESHLPRNIIYDILRENGIEGYDKLILTSEMGLSKEDGSVFEYIKSIYKLHDKKKVMHIGSDHYLDVVMSKKYNIEGIQYKNIKEHSKINNLTDSIIYAIKANSELCNASCDYWTNFGIKYVSPIYVGVMLDLAKWLNDKDNIYFLARDGYIPSRLYSIMKENSVELPEGKYIYASRRAYIYPTLPENRENAIRFLTLYNSSFGQNLTLDEIFKNIGLDINNYLDVIKRYKINSPKDIIDYNNIKNVKKILCFIWDDVRKVLLEEKSILNKYLDQEGILDKEAVNIFDIGWAGSTHKALHKLINRRVNGYYFGTISSIDSEIKSWSYGYAFNEGEKKEVSKFIMYNVMMYELIFTSPEGSLKKFKYDNNGFVKPELITKNNSLNYREIKKFQDSAIEVFKKVLIYKDYISQPSKEFVLSFMNDFIENKDLEDLIEFEKIKNVVSIGESNDYKRYVTKIMSKDYLKNHVYYKELSNKNLWRDTTIIEDDEGFLYTAKDFDKLNNIKRNYFIMVVKKVMTIIRKCLIKIVRIL